MVTNQKLTQAIQLALLSSATAAAGLYTPAAISQDQSLGEIVVTGSRIRRVDAETASPVFTVNRDAIAASGVTTIGTLLQQVPAISGAATNTSVNNGGGDGASTIELRGLGDERTLILLNGRRMTGIAGNGAVDVNIFPVNLIERVDVLKEGAGAVYGSDAIGGVVNFITRTDFDGVEVSYDYGNSSESDGRRDSISLAWGMNSDKGNVVFGANYNKQEEILAGDRAFAHDALYLYNFPVYGITHGGSSRAPNGRIRLPATGPAHDFYVDATHPTGCGSVTKLDGVDGTHLADYRCFVTSGTPNDFYNYQPINLLITPSERGTLFTSANYKLTEDVEVYTELLHNYTTSRAKIAELPFDSRDDNIIIPANNFYNPFGIDFGGIAAVNPDADWRMKSLGQRRFGFSTTSDQIALGVRGAIMDSGWDWDLSTGYTRIDQTTLTEGYLLSHKVQDAFGPSFLDPVSGNVVCGVPGDIISGCVPINIFDINNPDQDAALATISASSSTATLLTVKSAGFGVTGEAFNMPAGKVGLAAGVEYTEYFYKFDTDSITDAQPPLFLTCGLAQEACSSDTRGDYNVNSVYAEALIPLVKDKPGATALNLIVGSRYSDYNTFGDTTDSSVKLEWRPFGDLLVRASWSEVFRAPQISDLFAGRFSNAPTFDDPCNALQAGDVTANPNLALACENVPQDGTFSEPNSQVTGQFRGNPDLDPETGEVLTAGFVYQPSQLEGFSVTFDYWQYDLNQVITSLDVNTTATVCVASGAAAVTPLPGNPTFCSLMHRNPDGTIQYIEQPTLNFGKLETDGYDIGLRYALNDTAAGSFQFTLDMTYIDKYDSNPCDVCEVNHVAGTFDRQYGNYADWRGLASVGWSWHDFMANVSARYVAGMFIKDGDGSPVVDADLSIPSVTYYNLTLGYNYGEKLSAQIGVDNLTDKQPPILFQNNVLNANTDVSTYDTIGRYFRAQLKYKF